MSREVLVVDPDADERTETVGSLREAGFDVAEAATLAEGTDEMSEVSCVVSEYALPDGNGFELVTAVREHHPDTPCVLFTDIEHSEIDLDRTNGEIAEYVPKGTANARRLLADVVSHSIEARTQTAYPIPDDEGERVAAVQQYAPDPERTRAALDRLSRVAAAVFDVPMAGIGLIDEGHQEFISCHGIELDTISREETICTYAMLEEEVTVIEDTREDPRFENNETLADESIRFYASANLTAPSGEVIGTFCVYDREPRSPTAKQLEMLQLLAEEAMEKLDLRRRLRETGER